MTLYTKEKFCTAVEAFNEENAFYGEATLADVKRYLAEQGLTVVPVDPTKEMIEIGGKAIEQCFFANYATTRADQAYRAMIEAAQPNTNQQ